MKIKSCYLARMIESEDAVKEYTEELGCTIRHKFSPFEGTIVYTIEDATGNKSVLFYLSEKLKSLACSDVGTRLVVDDIQEAVDYFVNKGYRTLSEPVETESNIICTVMKDTDFKVIFKHKRKD